jgi:hypothetical protein
MQRLLRALRRKAAEHLVAQQALGGATIAAPLPRAVDGWGYVGPDPLTAPTIEQAGKVTWRGRSIDGCAAPSG